MKKFKLTILLFSGLLIIKSQNIAAQNLQFNQAVFNMYGPGNADGNNATPMFTGSLIVGANQVLKITYINCSSDNAIVNGILGQPQNGWLTINSIATIVNDDTELWLPTGTYTIAGREMSSVYNGGEYKGLISGVLYDIVP